MSPYSWTSLTFAAALAAPAAPALAQEADAPAEAGEPEQPEEPEAGAAARDPGPSPAEELMAVIRNEPPVREVQRACLDHFRLQPERVRGLAAKANARWLIPDLTGSLRQEQGDRDGRMTDAFYADIYPTKEQTIETSGSVAYEVSANWSLRGLIFDNAELDVYSLVGVQESLLREVTTLYYTRRRMQVSLALNPPQDDMEMITEALRVEEITATLDALTGGLFTRRLGGEES